MAIDITGLDKAELLVALFNAAKKRSAVFHDDLSIEDARELLSDGTLSFGYVDTRALQINLRHDELQTTMYNHHNGVNAAEDAVAALRKSMKVPA